MREWIRCCLLAVYLVCVCAATVASGKEPVAPALMLATTYEENLDLENYWVSEKLDGVRAYWDGEALLARSGNRISAPVWFTASLPATALDGELWLGRDRFDELSGLVRRHVAVDADWKEVLYMVFDLPHSPHDFDRRLELLAALVESEGIAWLRMIPQFRVGSPEELRSELDRVVALGGEGLMLHRGASHYHSLRNEDLVKLKPIYDAEAVVLARIPGKASPDMMGSLLVETPEGIRFRLGTGFSDAERRAPPAPGSLVTYEFSGFTPNGVPRFARFVRVRQTP